MATKKQILANRRNARHSTGPRTPEGKARSSRNGIKHGFHCKHAVIPGEDEQDFDALHQSFRKVYDPADDVEEALVRQMASAEWRLQRLMRHESGTYWLLYKNEFGEGASMNQPPASDQQRDRDHSFTSRAYYEKSARLDLFARYSRHENALRRGFYKAMEHLERRQKQRQNQLPPSAEHSDQNKNCDPNPISTQPYPNQMDRGRFVKPEIAANASRLDMIQPLMEETTRPPASLSCQH